MKIAVIGLGKLGSPMAACFASKGHKVVGVDMNTDFVAKINAGQAPVFEPGLQELLQQAGDNLTATCDTKSAVRQSDFTFLIVPTPSQDDGFFSLDYVFSAIRPVAEVIAEKDEFHVVVLTSTVMPGATGNQLLPEIERISGKKCGQDFGVCYSPEFISLGSVIRDYLCPDFTLIGESDERSGTLLESIYTSVVENDAAVQRMSFANAELTKLALNTFVTTKISYANMLAEICEHLDDGNVDVVTNALGLDTRIGRKYLKGSVGYGGPCFPRDNKAITAMCQQLGITAPLPLATDEINRHQVPRLHQAVISRLPSGGTAGILGLAYKPDTNFVEKAQGLMLAESLLAAGVDVVAYDPAATETAKRSLGDSIRYTSTAADCVAQSDVAVLTLPCPEFKAIQPQDALGGHAIIDCWRILDRDAFSKVCDYVAWGTSDVARPPVDTSSHTQSITAKAA